MKKPLIIIIIIVLVLITAGLFIKGFGGAGIFGKISGNVFTKKQSIMDQARQQGMPVPNKTEAVKECEKETDQDEKDTCYGILAFYYRDASFCKYIKDPEMKNNCNLENIEKWYKDLEEMGKAYKEGQSLPGGYPSFPGAGMFPTEGLIPGEGTGGGAGSEAEVENAEPENIPSDTSSQTKPAIAPSGKITDEIYIDIMAHMYVYAQDPSGYTNYALRVNDLFAKYGITEEDLAAYGEEIEKDPQRAESIVQRYIERATELQGMGQ